jgi:hypothetical protein
VASEPPRARLVAAAAGVAVSAAGLAASGAAVYVAMRHTMVNTGAFCASGGPYVIANECEQEPFALLAGGIIAYLVCAAVHWAFTAWVGGPQIGVFAVCGALFLALGWNFIDLGLDPPTGEGPTVGWLVSGVSFWIMGFLFMVPAALRALEWLRRGGEPEPPVFSPSVLQTLTAERTGSPAPPPAAAAPPAPRGAGVPTRLVPPDRSGAGS